MKLATYKDGSRDGVLVVVSTDLRQACYATHAASRMQQVLDDWNFISPQLEELSRQLNAGRAPHAFAFDPARCMAPLPRAFQRVHADVYGGEDALSSQGGIWQAQSDHHLGPCDAVAWPGAELEGDFEAGLAVICGDLAQGAPAEQALEAVRLVMLCSGVRLRKLANVPRLGALLSHPAMVYGPVAVTPDELGEAWREGRAHLGLQVQCNGRKLGLLDTGADMLLGFDEVLASLCRTRALGAGTLITAGPVRNRDARKGVASLADRRLQERQEHEEASTAWLAPADSLRIEARGRHGRHPLGAINHDFILPREQP